MSRALGNNLQPRVARGKFTGTGAAIKFGPSEGIEFSPRYVRVFNQDGVATMEWFAGMAQDSGLKTITAGTMSVVTSAGITINEKFERDDAGDGPGFTLGADTDVNVASEVGFWLAME